MRESLRAPSSSSVSCRVEPSELRAHLRAATRDVHGDLDRRFAAILDPAADSLYRAFLRMNAACHGVLEAWLAARLPRPVAGLRRPLTGALEADMAALALEPVPVAEPWPPFAPSRRGLPEAAGVLYVVDGSRLGARMILKGWERRLDETREEDRTGAHGAAEGRPTAFLTAAATGAVFPAFDALCAHLDFYDHARITEAAQAAFKLFEGTSALTIDAAI